MISVPFLIGFGNPVKTLTNLPGIEHANTTAITTLTIDTASPGSPIDERLLGTNLPTWLNPYRFSDSTFLARSIALGTTMVRMPGGSWSNYYDWSSCENWGPCPWTWGVSRPTDFIDYLQATGIEGMWTVNQNGTSKEAAALVAFFNASTSDHQVIGVDVQGRDWGKVSDWAQLRTDHGNPDPIGLQYWEIGNEIYGGKSGTDCTAWGWEDVWTCDGREYVLGIGSGGSRKEGYLEFQAAMQAVDPSIQVGAVGISIQSDWSNWGNEVIEEAGEAMDFYVIHEYGFFNPPANYSELLSRPQALWGPMMANVQAGFDQYAGGRRVPVAVTEYNLFSVEGQDTGQWMSRAVNGLFIADSIGQMMQHGFAMAHQWDIAHAEGSTPPGYGLMQASTYFRSPQYYALHIWSHFGDEMLPVTNPLPADTQLSVYAGRVDGDTLTLLAINKTGNPISTQVVLQGVTAVSGGQVYTVEANSLDDMVVTYNGVSDPSNDLSNAPPEALPPAGSTLDYNFSAYSITLLQIDVGAQNPIYIPLVNK
jgi:hypothetical protein